MEYAEYSLIVSFFSIIDWSWNAFLFKHYSTIKESRKLAAFSNIDEVELVLQNQTIERPFSLLGKSYWYQDANEEGCFCKYDSILSWRMEHLGILTVYDILTLNAVWRQDDYLALEVSEGKVMLTMDLGSGHKKIINDEPVADDQWHQVIVDRYQLALSD